MTSILWTRYLHIDFYYEQRRGFVCYVWCVLIMCLRAWAGRMLCRARRSLSTSGTTVTLLIVVRGMRAGCPEFHRIPRMASLPSTWPTSASQIRDGTNVKWFSSIGPQVLGMVPGFIWMSTVSTLQWWLLGIEQLSVFMLHAYKPSAKTTFCCWNWLFMLLQVCISKSRNFPNS